MLILGKIHAGSETNWKVPVGSGYESGSDKNHFRSTILMSNVACS